MSFRPNMAWVRPFLVIALVVSVPPLLYWFGYVNRSVNAAVRQYHTTTSAIAASLAERLRAHEQIAIKAEDLRPDQDRRAYLRSMLDGTITRVGGFSTHLTTAEDERGLVITVKDPKTDKPLSLSVELAKVIPWDMVEADFDGLLLLSGDGRLLAQDRRLPEQARGLPIPVTLEGRLIDVSRIFPGATKGQGTAEPAPKSGDARADSAATATRPAWRSPLDFSRFPEVVIGGTRYVAFVQPVRTFTTPVNVHPSDEPNVLKAPVDMVVVALVQQERLRSQAISLSPKTLVRVITLIGLGLLLIPFLKLRFIGANERMRSRDLWVMMGSMLGIGAVATLLVMEGFATRSLIAGLDDGLVSLHKEIRGHAAAEMKAAVQQLRNSPAELSEFNGPYLERSGLDAAKPLDHCGTMSRLARSRGAVLLTEPKLTYPAFDTISLVNARDDGSPGAVSGQQTQKWMPRTDSTGLVNVVDRPYFRDALTLDPANESGMGVQFIVSWTTGLEQLVLALPMKCTTQQATAILGPAVAPAERTHVATLSTAFPSLSRTVVPAPYEFLLVDHDGMVTFRNAKGPYLGERFFERVLGGIALEPAPISTHGAQAADFSYRWQSYRMLASAVPDLEMSLVTSYDVEEARRLAARAFGVASLFALLAILSTLLGALLATAIWHRSSHDWLWPVVDDTGRYLAGIAACALAVILLIAAREYLSSLWFAVAVVTVPGIVTFLCGSPLWFRYRLAFRIWADGPSMATHKVAYCAFLTAMLLALAVVPTVLAYDDALRLYASGYERASAIKWSRNEQRLRAKFEAEYARVDASGEPDNAAQCNAPGRICATPDHYYRLREALTTWGLYTQCPAPLRKEGSGATACRSVLSPGHQLPWSFTGLIARPLARMGEAGPLLSKALNLQDENPAGPKVRPLDGWQKTGWLWWVWAAAGLALLVVLVRSVAVHVLGLGWRNVRSLDASTSIETVPGTKWLLIRPTKAVLDGLESRATHSIDLRHSAGSSGMVPPRSGEVLLVKHLEIALEDPARRDSLFALAASPAEGCLVFCSEIDPFYYVTQRAREAFDVVQGGSSRTEAAVASTADTYVQLQAQRARWAGLLSDFRKVRVRRPDFPALGGHVPSHCRRILESECAGSEPLIEIAQRLAMSPDLPNFREDEIVGFVLDAAEPYYRSLWELCSRDERLVLIQLAEEGVVNPKQLRTLRRLHTRGLVVVEPRFDVMNSSFRRFVRSVESPERVREWERTEAARGWRRFSAPLYTMAAVMIGVLLFTQQDLFYQVLGIATGAAGALNSLRSLGLLASASKAEAPRTVKA